MKQFTPRGALSRRALCAYLGVLAICCANRIAHAQQPGWAQQFPSQRAPAASHQQPAAAQYRMSQAQPVAQPRPLTSQPMAPQGPEEITPSLRLPAPVMNQPARRLPLLGAVAPGPNDPPRNPAVEKEYSRFVDQPVIPQVTRDLIVGRTIIFPFKEAPLRIYLARDSVASYDVISAREIAVTGVAPGNTVMYIWVNDPRNPGKQVILSYLLRVSQDATQRVRWEAVYQELEKEINRDFPDSFVKLSLIGDQLVVRGQAKDVIEAAQIIRILNEHAPPSRQRNSNTQPANLSVSQTTYSPQGVLQTNEQLDTTLAQLSNAAGLQGDSNVINMLSIPGEQQVMLRVTVAEVNRSALRSIGTSMRIEGSAGPGFDSSFPPRVGDLVDTTLMVLEGGTFSLARGDFRLTIDALKQHNLAKTLAEPNLVTLHGRPARFQAGGQFPVPSAQVGFGSAAQGVTFVPFGVQLQFVPYIVDRDKIRLNVAANVSTRDDAAATNIAGSNVPGLNSRNFQNTVELRDGQTLAVAGLIQTNFGANSSRVPGLGDVPVLGRLFNRDGTTADEQELVILITPELVHPVDSKECLSLPGSDVLEPSDIEFFLKGRLESRRTQNFRSPVRTDWAKLKRYNRCEEGLLIGPVGHSYGAPDPAGGGHLRSPLPAPAFPAAGGSHTITDQPASGAPVIIHQQPSQ